MNAINGTPWFFHYISDNPCKVNPHKCLLAKCLALSKSPRNSWQRWGRSRKEKKEPHTPLPQIQNCCKPLLRCTKWSAPKGWKTLLPEAPPISLPTFPTILQSQGFFTGILFCLRFLDSLIPSLWRPAYNSINWTLWPSSQWLRFCVGVWKAPLLLTGEAK